MKDATKNFEIDEKLLEDLVKYVEGSLPVHKRVGGALDQKRLLDRLRTLRTNDKLS
jgi:hypothetical protein